MNDYLETSQVTQTFSLTMRQVAIISAAVQRLGLKNRSEAVRRIIDQWADQNPQNTIVSEPEPAAEAN